MTHSSPRGLPANVFGWNRWPLRIEIVVARPGRCAQSTAMSQPELPEPTTSTRVPSMSAVLLYVAACSWRPV